MFLAAVTGDEVVGVLGLGQRPVLRAISASDGTMRWTYPLPASQPDVLGLVAGDGVVIVEVGHNSAGPMQSPLVRVARRHRRSQRSPPMVAVGRRKYAETARCGTASNLVVTGDPLGTLNAREAHTGKRAWRRDRPATSAKATLLQYDEAVAADGSLLAVSYQCATRTTSQSLVERLDPADGTRIWEWSTPPLYGPLGEPLSVIGTASSPGAVFVTGHLPPKAKTLAGQLGRTFTWPSALGQSGQTTTVSLDAATGHPRWNEFGAGDSGNPNSQLVLADGAMCELAIEGFECPRRRHGRADPTDVHLRLQRSQPSPIRVRRICRAHSHVGRCRELDGEQQDGDRRPHADPRDESGRAPERRRWYGYGGWQPFQRLHRRCRPSRDRRHPSSVAPDRRRVVSDPRNQRYSPNLDLREIESSGQRCFLTRWRTIPLPQHVKTLTVAVAAGNFSASAVVASGAVSCWGDNEAGELGHGTVSKGSALPVSVKGLA